MAHRLQQTAEILDLAERLSALSSAPCASPPAQFSSLLVLALLDCFPLLQFLFSQKLRIAPCPCLVPPRVEGVQGLESLRSQNKFSVPETLRAQDQLQPQDECGAFRPRRLNSHQGSAQQR